MTPNHALLEYSIQKPEPIYDPAYQKELLVIRESPEVLNALLGIRMKGKCDEVQKKTCCD